MTNFPHFSYNEDGLLFAEDVSLATLAQNHDTPLYVYSKKALVENFLAYALAAKEHEYKNCSSFICYSVKSNSNLAILKILGDLNAGFDIVSGGELARVIAAGCDPRKVVFSGVGKTAKEIAFALENDIYCFNVESLEELHRINAVAENLNIPARIAFRVNPDVDAKTHPYISTGLKENKFGIPYEQAIDCYQTAHELPFITIAGIDCHIGSQLLDDTPILDAFDRVAHLVDQLEEKGIRISHMDLGGGIGITYNEEKPVVVSEYIQRLYTRMKQWRKEKYNDRPMRIILEPGRSICGNAGILLSTVQYLKSNGSKNFAVIDAAMNDLVRPAMYEAWHSIFPIEKRDMPTTNYDVVGPICESGDWLAKDRPLSIQSGDVVALFSAGAYGMAMASNYNSRGRAAEIIVDGDQSYLIRRRETPDDIYALEKVLP